VRSSENVSRCKCCTFPWNPKLQLLQELVRKPRVRHTPNTALLLWDAGTGYMTAETFPALHVGDQRISMAARLLW